MNEARVAALARAADLAYNRDLLTKCGAAMTEFPTVRGRLAIRSNAVPGNLRIGEGVVVNSTVEIAFGARAKTAWWLLTENASISVGDRVHMSNVALVAREQIVLEEDVWLGTGAQVVDTDFHSLDFDERVADTNIATAPVRICARAFVGMNALILKGVTVGTESVIGAGAVVTSDVPAGEVWGGNPARFLKKL